jgi:hypothetical protein
MNFGGETSVLLLKREKKIVHKDNTRKSPLIQLACLLLFIAVLVFIFLKKDMLTLSPWNNDGVIEWSTYAGGNAERTAVIANSGSSVYVLNREGELLYRMDAKPGAARFFSSAKFAELDEDNNLYVLDAVFGGAFDENSERVLKYSVKGKFIQELYAYNYTNENFIVTKGKISGLACFDNAVYLVRLEDQGLYLERVPAAGGEAETIVFVAYPNAFRDIAFVHVNAKDKLLAVTTKAGTVMLYDFGGDVQYVREALPNSLPWTAASTDDVIIYADILAREIAKINIKTGEQTLLYRTPPKEWAYYRINYAGGILFASPYDQMTAVALFSDIRDPMPEVKKINGYSYSKDDRMLRIILFVGALLDIVLLLTLLILNFSRISISGRIKSIILAGVCIAFGAVISSLLITNEMTERYNDKTYEGLENVARLTAASIDERLLAGITSPLQSESEEFIEFKNVLQAQFAQLQFRGKQVYQTISKEQDGIIYTLYDLENSVGTFFPFFEYDSLYQEVAATKQFIRSQALSSEGNWLFVCGPILDANGEAGAFIETGYNTRSVYGETRKTVLKTWIVIVAAAALVFLVVVGSALLLKRRNKNRTEQ